LKRIKLTYIISNIQKSLAFEWVAENLDHSKYELSFVFLNSEKYPIQEYMEHRNIETHLIFNNGKRSYPFIFLKLFARFLLNRPSIVHCHMFDATLLGLLVSKLLHIKKRIYTRHNATFNREYFPKMVKWDKFNNSLATHVVAISRNVKEVLETLENVPSNKIELIPHGFDLERFRNIPNNDKNRIFKKYNIESNRDYPVVGVISRFLHLKGIQYVIPAFRLLLEKKPNAVLILCNANGPYSNEIEKLLSSLPERSYRKITFEEDIFALYSIFDVFLHVPINEKIEAFGQTYVEALSAGVPSVFTLSGIAVEFIVDEQNALVVDFKDSGQIYSAMIKILNSDKLRDKLIMEGFKSIKPYNLTTFVNRLHKLYE